MIFSLLAAIVFAFPNLSVYLIIFLAYFGKYVSALFCLIFAWNMAKFVEYRYEKYLEKTK